VEPEHHKNGAACHPFPWSGPSRCLSSGMKTRESGAIARGRSFPHAARHADP
jgi:hypothetical protein